MIARFMEECPKVEVLLESANRRVDVIREGFNLAIRVRFPTLEDSDLVVRKLADSPQRLVASPSILKEASGPLLPADLAAPSLARDPTRLEHDWQLEGPDSATATIRHRPRFITEDMMALRAELRGGGVCQFPTFRVAEDLKAGWLIDLLPERSSRPGIIHAVFPTRRRLVPTV
jgi:DNA-binding transcriptional LysR family regulator